jgi:hypothetical protein
MDTKTETKVIAVTDPAMASLKDYVDQKYAVAQVETAKLNASIMSSVKAFPWMGVMVGGIGAVASTELIDGVIPAGKPKYWNAAAKIIVGVGGYMLLKKVKFVGSEGALVFGAMNVFDGVRDVVPFDTYIQKGVSTLVGHPVTAGLAQSSSRPLGAVAQANKILTSSQMMASRS